MGISEIEAKRILGDKYPKVISRPEHVSPVPPASCSDRCMNKTETKYSCQLENLRHCGHVLAWKFEALTFRLAYRCHYTPDFLVVTPVEIQIHEVKGGYVREDGLVKWKMAAELHPEFRFYLCRYMEGVWRIDEYHGN